MSAQSIASFLSSLPAILGIVGFVIYYMLKRSALEDPVIKSILERSAYKEPTLLKSLTELSPKQQDKLLKYDYTLRGKISLEDLKLLDKALSSQHNTNRFVYSLCAGLLIAGIVLYLKPQPLAIDNITIQNTDTSASDLVVDIDPLSVTWTSSGSDGEVYVALENIATGQQSQRYRARASDGKIVLEPDKYTNFNKVLSDRTPNEVNRIRAIIYAGKAFPSKSFDLKVGVRIICYDKPPRELMFNAIVDQRIIDNFHFAPRLQLFQDNKFNGGKRFEASEYSSRPTIIVENPQNFLPDGFVFTVNPRDMVNEKIYRTDINSLREAIMSLKNVKRPMTIQRRLSMSGLTDDD